jgi:hypothetical protein
MTAGVLLLRAAPLIRAYAGKLLSRHPLEAVAGALGAGVLALAVLALALWKRPRMAVAGLGAVTLAMLLLSGNAPEALVAAAILGFTTILGDAVFRLLAGGEAGEGDLPAVFATGAVTAGVLVLVLGEAGVLGATSVGVIAAAVLLPRRRRAAALIRLARAAARLPFGNAPRWLEAGWLALASLFLLATWAGALSPDLSWDGLAYHLPEARDIAVSGRVRPLPDLHPQSLLWRGHDAWLALAFLAGGPHAESAERIVQLLQFGTGLFVFAAALSLARRLGAAGASPLIVLALAAFPTAMLQLRSAYVDWPAALVVTAAAAQIAALPSAAQIAALPSAAQIAALPGRPGRLRVAGFLFGGAVAIKIFALFAAPALLLLALRARASASRLLAAALCALIPLAPWLAWSHVRAGSIAAPYASSAGELLQRVWSGHYFTRSPATGEERKDEARTVRRAAELWRLPHDLVYRSSRYEANGDGYNGLLVLLLVLGLAGWDTRRVLLFLAAALPFLVPWSLLYLPSIRFLFPVYPLYAVFTAEGLSRLAGRFQCAAGKAAGLAVLAVSAAFPVHVGSTGLEWTAALGRATREELRAERLPSLAFAGLLGPADRVLLVGENDRFHVPAGAVWRADFAPVASWRRDAAAWRRGLDELSITAVVWRSDRVPFPLPGLVGERLEPFAENGPARLFRVRARTGSVP